MPSELAQQIVERVNAIVREGRTTHDYHAFVVWFLETYFGVSSATVLNCLCDGTRDFGIDAIYIDEVDRRIFVIQSKYHRDFGSSSLARDDAEKSCRIFRYLETERGLAPVLDAANTRTCNLLRRVFHALHEENFDMKVLFLTSARPNAVAERLVRETFEYSPRKYQFIAYSDVLRVQQYYNSGLMPTIGAYRLRPHSKVIECSAGQYAVRLFTVGVKDLQLFVRECRRRNGDLLKANVRGFLGHTRTASKNIKKVLASERRNHFLVLHNGVCLIAQSVDIDPDGDELILDDPQVVNGGQTIRTLESIPAVHPQPEILVKLLECGDTDMIQEVTFAANSQSPVTPIDLRSNEKALVDLQRRFLTDNYFLIRKEGEEDTYPNIQGRSRRQEIDRVELAQAYYACLGHPGEARTGKSELFRDNDKFNAIFASDIPLQHYLTSVYLLWVVNTLVRTHADRFHEFEREQFLPYCKLHVIALIFSGIDSMPDANDLRGQFTSKYELDDEYVVRKLKPIFKLFFDLCYRVYGREASTTTTNVPNFFKAARSYSMLRATFPSKLSLIQRKLCAAIRRFS